MTLAWSDLVVDAQNPVVLGRWWAGALDWDIVTEDDEGIEIRDPGGARPALLFLIVPEAKSVKNRLHLDFVPDDQDAEVTRLIGLGARRVDIGQGEQTWVVMADPEGNEFCVLAARP
ncbi:MAG: VOC family protein [Microbacteriaceae bacterium]|nr:VOC family protein [Microbacteriaceae bacterium]